MNRSVSFRGASGRAVSFQPIAPDAPFARLAGVAVFAMRGDYGWRVLKVAELSGRIHDVRPILALSQAERYGADAVFVAREDDPFARRALCADLAAGLDPVCDAPRVAVAA